MLKKIKLLLIPYLLISIPVIVLYAIFCLKIYNKQGIVEISEDLIQLWIPIALPWIPVLIWLRPRIKLLKMRRDGRRSPDLGIMFLATLGMMLPMMGTSFYLEKYCGQLTILDKISTINNTTPSKYYTVDTFYVDKHHRGLYYSSYTSGRFNSRLNFEIHIVCPMYNRKYSEYSGDTSLGIIAPPMPAKVDDSVKADSIIFTPPAVVKDTEVIALGYGTGETENMKITPSAWIGINYNTSIGNLMSDAKKKEREHEFYRECLAKFDDSDMNHFTYLERVPDNDHRKHYRNAALNSIDSINVDHAIILEGDYGDFSTRTGNRLLWIFLAYAIVTLIFATIIFLIKFDESKLASFEAQNKIF